jgi:predicted phage terminase large subunit-like protein
MTVEEAKTIKVANVMCREDFLFHTAYFFKKRENRNFVINSHHEEIASFVEYILKGLLKKVIINMPPRYGKTEVAVINLVTHAFSLNTTARFIHLSYSQSLVEQNSEAIKGLIKSEAYQQLFPTVRIRSKSDSKKKWATTDGGTFYATSTGGQVTGHGAGKVDDVGKKTPAQIKKQNALLASQAIDAMFDEILKELDEWDAIELKQDFNGALIIDDPIKPEDADSETKRKRINERYDSTLKNRLNSRNTPVILIGQRTHELDLSGHVMATDGYTTSLEEAIANPKLWFLLSLPAIVDEGLETEHALWPFKHTLQELKDLQNAEPISFGRQYQQDPQPKEGFMYDTFRLYGYDETTIPMTLKSTRKNYTDTADTGKDFLCSGCYVETETAIYMTDILYTAKAMKETEPKTAMMLTKNKTKIARFESNNGGEGFARNVEVQTRLLKNTVTKFTTFHQTLNKELRIFTNSNRVNILIYMPADWETRWPDFAKAVKTHKKNGKNSHDDAADFLTGCAEWFGKDLLITTDPKVLSVFG